MSLIQVGKQIQTSSKIQTFRFQGNLLMGIANWFGTYNSICDTTNSSFDNSFSNNFSLFHL